MLASPSIPLTAIRTDRIPFRLCLGMYATGRDYVAHALSCQIRTDRRLGSVEDRADMIWS
jgi:hypothetical protein